MNPPADDVDLKPEKLEEEKEGGALFHCDLYDADIVHKIAQEFLPGLGSACVDNTTGGLFRSPASVAVDLRREMVDYLIQRSENFVAESVVLDGGPHEEVSEDPYDIISDFVDDFASSKRNFFSRVSGWLLSDRREERIDDFVQEMEINGFWLLNRRESVAQTLLKNVDFKNSYHCNMSFKSLEDLEEHKLNCGFRTMICANEGCSFRFSAAQLEHHDSICPFKILKCEQNCSDSIVRHEMDRHCVTVCPMKLVKCPFYSVGCHSSIPQCTIKQHRSENLSSHLLYILQVIHKEVSVEDLKERAEELVKSSSPGQLEAARDARSLTFAIKNLEAKLGPLKVSTTAKSSEEVRDSTDKKEEESTVSPTKEDSRFEESPTAKNRESESVDSHSPSPSPSKCIADCQLEKDSPAANASSSVQLESELKDNNNISFASNSVQKNLDESAAGREGVLVLDAQNKAHQVLQIEQEKPSGEEVGDDTLDAQNKAQLLQIEDQEKPSGEQVADDAMDAQNKAQPLQIEDQEKPSQEKVPDDALDAQNKAQLLQIEDQEKPSQEKEAEHEPEPVKSEHLKSPMKAEDQFTCSVQIQKRERDAVNDESTKESFN